MASILDHRNIALLALIKNKVWFKGQNDITV